MLYFNAIEKEIQAIIEKNKSSLFNPAYYQLENGGKRIRPQLTLAGCHLYKEDFNLALQAAIAIEWFHNSTLMHDDIMDDAKTRRGKKSVHRQWNINRAILTGDALIIESYKYLENLKPLVFKKAVKLFTKTALKVCEGQQMDIDFETRQEVAEKEYLKMIRLKTSVLIGFSVALGGLIGGAPKSQLKLLYDFGVNLGMAFQLKDDYLDVFGNVNRIGKMVYSDIIYNKKSIPFILAQKMASPSQKELLNYWYNQRLEDNKEKIRDVLSIFETLNIAQHLDKYTKKYSLVAMKKLDYIEHSNKEVINFLKNIVLQLNERQN